MPDSSGPFPKSAMRPLTICALAAALVAFLSIYLASVPGVQSLLVRILPSMVRLVPSVASIASETANSESSEIILLTQWCFAPIYCLVWFHCAPPWTRRTRDAALVRARTLSRAKRQIVMPVGMLVLVFWLLGDFGIIGFPILYNGKYAYPLDTAVPQVKLIYGSPVALAIYAWIGPLVEVGVVWMLLMCAINLKAYMLPSRSDSPGSGR